MKILLVRESWKQTCSFCLSLSEDMLLYSIRWLVDSATGPLVHCMSY